MMLAFLITFIFCLFVWLVFFKFKWLKFTKVWAVLSLFFAAHLFLIFVVGLRFVTPYSSNVTVVQHTIQLVPHLPDPTLVTAVARSVASADQDRDRTAGAIDCVFR